MVKINFIVTIDVGFFSYSKDLMKLNICFRIFRFIYNFWIIDKGNENLIVASALRMNDKETARMPCSREQ